MLDWVFNTYLSIALSSVKKGNLGTYNRQPITSLRLLLQFPKRRPWEVRSGRPWDVKSGRPKDVRWGSPRDHQIQCLGDVLGMLDEGCLREVLGTNICRLGSF